MNVNLVYKIAVTDVDFAAASQLFSEYAGQIGIDLSFQNFEEELKIIHVQYNHPAGGLILAQANQQYVGCAGVRKLDATMAELKRMYVQPAYRGHQIGVELLKRAIDLAVALGYQKMRLDTLANMTKAQALYQSFGFYNIPAYRYNPIEGTVYMEKLLS